MRFQFLFHRYGDEADIVIERSVGAFDFSLKSLEQSPNSLKFSNIRSIDRSLRDPNTGMPGVSGYVDLCCLSRMSDIYHFHLRSALHK